MRGRNLALVDVVCIPAAGPLLLLLHVVRRERRLRRGDFLMRSINALLNNKQREERVCMRERERCVMKVLLYLLKVQDFYIRNIILCCCSCSCFAKSSRRLLLPGTFVASPSLSTKCSKTRTLQLFVL